MHELAWDADSLLNSLTFYKILFIELTIEHLTHHLTLNLKL